ncbi:MAG: class I SAM-dependent methyltransferase [Planctomycetota bacterium]|jgi:SAM-dependent methyltransferase
MMSQFGNALQASYDRVADEYTRRFANEFDEKPLERELLRRFALDVRKRGPVCDLGCGPGQVARFLKDLDVDVFGLDLSQKLVDSARKLSPEIEFRQGDMRSLCDDDESWAGIAALYSIIHIPREQMMDTLRELRRVMQPGAPLLLSFHIGQEVLHVDELWGEQVSLEFAFFQPTEMRGYLSTAGFEIEDTIERDPYKDIEYQSRRAYVFARRLQ